jgi:UDP-glucuronate 4-epimerase
MKTVIVTGAAGFIGSNLSKELLLRGYRVVGIDNFDDTYDTRFKEEHVHALLPHEHFTLEHIDIRDRKAMMGLFLRAAPESVIHLAAKADTRAAVDDPYPYVDNNITGSLVVFDAAQHVGVKHIVNVSSSSVYGNMPTPWSESTITDMPISPYGATKRAVELFAHTYHHNFGIPITSLRYFNVYGEHNRPAMVPYKWAQALLRGEEIEMSGKGDRKRDYTYVGDTVRGTILALEHPNGNQTFNIGNNNPVSLRELLETFERVIGVKAKVRERESHKASVEDTYADITKAHSLLGWKPEVPLEEGITRLVEWVRANRL